ncbi:Endonuclease/exonuclease/phosphatase [Schizopora paradoxa]|uniref:Endonuclease/exonuclease/phosphatase n=1 Tax=Schizopora paradoxa TaxID=27342 RepID=A0A0H2S7N0_9AGAM|nr:Endonuclease/exonuclease/phosphatase [Schizopora paradoxa]
MPSQERTLTPEQIALSIERKRKKAEAALKAPSVQKPVEGVKILERKWLTSPNIKEETITNSITVMTWNMLAQCLVRRELFPTSDCLKAQQRQGMLHEEIRRSDADIICLQEVDRLESLVPFLESLGYSHTYSCGPRKKHGCLIAYRAQVFAKVTDWTVFYDDSEIRKDGEDASFRRGSSFRTRNIGLLVALEQVSSKETIVIATTHLFWHPRYTYERARQAYILARSVEEFKAAHDLKNSPSVIAGDFNFTPTDPAYSMLVGDPVLSTRAADFTVSRVVHVSLDPSVPIADPKKAVDDEEDGGEQPEEEDPDRVIKNARPARPEDGLLEAGELEKLFIDGSAGEPLQSLYDQWQFHGPGRAFVSRAPEAVNRRGKNEPIYSSYTHFWKSTLDYIFARPGQGSQLEVVSVLEPPSEEELSPGLPRKGVCGSDHISLCARISFTPVSRPEDDTLA